MGRTQELLQKAEANRRSISDSFRRAGQAALQPRLILKHLTGSRSGKVDVLAGVSLMIGRGEHNDVALDLFEDPTISAHHAEIRWEEEDFVIYDMGSLNGTFVNGQPIRRAVLVDNDVIGLGRTGARMAFQEKPGVLAPTDSPRSLSPAVGDARAPVATAQETMIQDLDDWAPRNDKTHRLLIIVATLALVDAVLHIIDLIR